MLYQKLKIVKSEQRFSQSEKRKIAAAKARAGREFPSPEPPFLPAPPERQVLFLPREARQAVNFVQNRFGFYRINAPVLNFRLFGRPLRRRFAPPHREKLGFRPLRGSLNEGSKFFAILSICFAK